MTKAQKSTLRYAYHLIQAHYQNRTYLTQISHNAIQGWLVPDTDPTLEYLNEAVCATLVMSGHLECRNFQAEQLWRYRITPEGCAAIGKHYPGLRSSILLKSGRIDQQHKRHIDPNFKPNQHDIHRFRRSSDWRRC